MQGGGGGAGRENMQSVRVRRGKNAHRSIH